MAEKSSVTVQSSKNSVISKVEVITVPANDVRNLTSRQPVAVVVAEKLCPTASSSGDQRKPKRVFVPGCPLPQILTSDYDDNISEAPREKLSSQQQWFRRPQKHGASNSNVKPQKVSKAVTFRLDKPKNNKVYNQKDYKCSFDRPIAFGISSDSNETYGQNQPFNGMHQSISPRYTLVSRGIRDAYDTESLVDSNEEANFRNGQMTCGCSSLSECNCIHSSSEDVITIGADRGKTSYEAFADETSDSGTSTNVEQISGKCARFQILSPDEVDVFHSENSEQMTSCSVEDYLSETDRIMKVKTGGLHIRQRPHILETKREYDSEKYKSKVNQILKCDKNKCESSVVDHKKFMRGSFLSNTRPAFFSSSKASRSSAASIKRSEHITDGAVMKVKKPPTKARTLQHPPNDQRSGTLPRTDGKAKTISWGSTTSHGKGGQVPSKVKSSSKTLSKRPSTAEDGSRMKLEASEVFSSEGRSKRPSPAEDGGRMRPDSSEVFSPEGHESPEITSVFPLTPSDFLESGVGSKPILEDISPDDSNLRLEEFVTLAQWAKDEREKLLQDSRSLFDPPKSRVSGILQQLTNNTFDEDKYFITRRVESHISRAYQNALDNIGKTSDLISATDDTEGMESSVPRQVFKDDFHGLPSTAFFTSTTTTTTAITTSKVPKEERQKAFRPHPPPLFSHRWLSQGQTTATTFPLQIDSFRHARHPQHRHKKKKAVTKTKLKQETIGRATQHVSPDGQEEMEGVPLRVGVPGTSPPPADRITQRAADKKSHLQVCYQEGVDIPTRRVTEKIASISIFPRDPSVQPKERKHAVVEVVHQSMNGETSEDSILADSRDVYTRDQQHSGDHDEEKVVMISGNVTRADSSPYSVSSSSASSSSLSIPTPTPVTLPTPSSPPPPPIDQVQGNIGEEVNNKFHTEEIEEDDEDMHGTGEELHHPRDPKTPAVYEDQTQDSMVHSSRESDTDAYLANAEDLPGYMPEIRWEEVAIENRRDGDIEEFNRGILQQAEDRLLELDVQERILNRIEEQMQTMLLRGQDNLYGADFEMTSSDFPRGELPKDIHDRQDLTSEMVRAVLFDVVRERLRQAPQQVNQQEISGSEQATLKTGSSRPVYSPSSSSTDEESGTSASVITPAGSPTVQVPKTGIDKVRTPSPSPPPSPLFPGSDNVEIHHMPTPQDSLEGPDNSIGEDIVATPSSSPPSGLSVIATFPPDTPAVTPAGSPSKPKLRYPAGTPVATPAGSPSKPKPRYPTRTPAATPVGSPGRLKPKYPAETPAATPIGSPGRLKPKSPAETPAGTPTQSPIISDWREKAPDTPTRSPSFQRRDGIQVELPRTPTPTESPVNLHPSSIAQLSTSSEVMLSGRRQPGIILTPSYLNQGTQIELPKSNQPRTIDKAVLICQDESQEFFSEDTLSVVCHSSADVTASSPVEASDTTYMTLSEGEMLNGRSPIDMSLEEGEIARTCHSNMPYHQGPHVCSSHKNLEYRVQQENEVLKSEGEMLIHISSEELSSNGVEFLLPGQAADSTASDVTEDNISSLQNEGSVSVIQNLTYSSGDVTAMSSECLDALRQENAALLYRLSNLGSFRFLSKNSQSTGSSSDTGYE